MDHTTYGLHREGQPIAFMVWHEEAPAALYDVGIAYDGIGNVRFTGTFINENGYPLKSVRVAVSLLDGAGAIVGLGSTTLVGGLEQGKSDTFDLHVPYTTYPRFEIEAEGIRHWPGAMAIGRTAPPSGG